MSTAAIESSHQWAEYFIKLLTKDQLGQPVTGHASEDTQTKLCAGALLKDATFVTQNIATFVSKATFVVPTFATLAATLGSDRKCKIPTHRMKRILRAY